MTTPNTPGWQGIRNSLARQRDQLQFFVRLWVLSRRPPTSPNNVVAKNAHIFSHFAPNSTLFGVGGEGSLVLVISLERSQHF